MIQPRYEFRAFAENFGPVEEKIRELSKLEKFRESSEIYILLSGNLDNNIKIRYNTLDIKVLVKEEKGLQQWTPRIKEPFPLKMEVIRDQVLAPLNVTVPQLNRAEYSMEQYLEDIIKPHPDLVSAQVNKRRFGYTVNGCISEIAELEINGSAIKSIAVESVNPEAVLKTKEILGLQEYENENYPAAIKRVLAIEETF